MRTKIDLTSAEGLTTLMTHTLMGAALGLVFSLALISSNSAVATLLSHGGNQASAVFALASVMIFAIGATLSGIVLIFVEDKQS